MAAVSVTRRPRFALQRDLVVTTSVRSGVNPMATVGLEGLGKLKKCNDIIRTRTPRPSGLHHSASTICATAFPPNVREPSTFYAVLLLTFFILDNDTSAARYCARIVYF
jgi:hypothetical protein